MASKKRTFPVDPTIRSSLDTTFPHCWDRKLCYIKLRDGALSQPAGRNEIRDAVRRAYHGKSQLYCAWPGQWRTDLFVIDDLAEAAKALGVDLDKKPAPAWVPPTPEEKAASQLRSIRIATAEGKAADVIALLYRVTLEEVTAAQAVPMSDTERTEIEAIAAKNIKRQRATAKAAATRARNKAAREAEAPTA